MKHLLLSFCVILFFSCRISTEHKKEENTYRILSLLIEEFAKPTIPPREMYGLKPFTEVQIDSILNQDKKICLFPIQKRTHQKFSKKEKFDKEFNELVNKLKDLEDSREVDLSKIKINRPYQLSIIDTVAMKRDRRYVEKNFDKLINFSRISFNQGYTKAVIIVGVNMGPLNGYASLVFLEKIDNIWQIKGTDTFSIS
ncbi:vWA domain-containing protein [Aquimarina sediminis]|uniref:hypothetical protein n=1 Tax=Aquimarina sediminis TaxID=2070536 RepID=UPI000CA07840|nr:hypothetical protein [Aquimarina sediminis]